MAGLAYGDGLDFAVQQTDNFQYITSSFEHVTPLTPEFATSAASTADYLTAHPDRQLTITGHYQESENNGSDYANLGLARASDVAGYLSSQGVNPDQIVTNSAVVGDDAFNANRLTRGVSYAFDSANTGTARIEDIRAKLVGKPLVFYFNTNAASIQASKAQEAELADMKYYLENSPASSVEVSGHTDNVGNRAANLSLSKARADKVKAYLVSNYELDSARIAASGLGPDKPMESNDTESGKAADRRVEVTLR